MSIVGTLNFEYPKLAYQYTDAFTTLITGYKEVTDIFASGTSNKIGTLFIETQTQQKLDGNSVGQVLHTYTLPQGSFQSVYLEETMTPGGAFLPNTTTYGTVVSGSGNFLGSIGVSSVTVDNTPIRKVKVNFTDKAVYPLPNLPSVRASGRPLPPPGGVTGPVGP